MRIIQQMPAGMLRSEVKDPEGFDVLREVGTGLVEEEDESLALTLWLCLRRVYLWADIAPENRPVLRVRAKAVAARLAAAQEQAPELAPSLDILAKLWNRPDRVGPEQIATACDRVGRWAADRGLLRTAALFMEGAAVADGEDTMRALHAAFMCQRLRTPQAIARAEQWHERAFGLARSAQRSARLLMIRALLAYGNWAVDVERFRLAKRCYVLADRRALRYGRNTYRAVANHNQLALLLSTGGTLEEGEALAMCALENYPRSDARIPRLAHDFAALLIRKGCFGAAFQLLVELPPLIREPEVRLRVWSSLAWAAGAVGRQDVFKRAMDCSAPLLDAHRDFAGKSLVQFAEGALRLGDLQRADELARWGATISGELGDNSGRRAALALLDRIGEGDRQPVRTEPYSSAVCIRLSQALGARTRGRFSRKRAKEDRPSPPRPKTDPVAPAPEWPVWGGAETLAGLSSLSEAGSSQTQHPIEPLALALWTALRRARHWVDMQEWTGEGAAPVYPIPSEGTQLNSPIPDLEAAFRTFAELPRLQRGAADEAVAEACHDVGRWAADQGRLRTAVLFLETAAKVQADSAARALDAGEMCQRFGGAVLRARAEQWFERAFQLARNAPVGRQLLCIRALLTYGNWGLETRDFDLAGECFGAAARRANRYNRRTYYAVARHNQLGVVIATGGGLPEGEALVQEALDHYPRADARLLRLAHDYAVLLNRHGHFRHAFRVLSDLPPLVREPHLRLLGYSSLAWAAGGSGHRGRFEEAFAAVLSLASVHEDFAPNALVQVAEGAFCLGLVERAREIAARGREAAKLRADEEVGEAAAAVLAKIESGQPATPVAALPATSRFAVLDRLLGARITRFRT